MGVFMSLNNFYKINKNNSEILSSPWDCFWIWDDTTLGAVLGHLF